MKFEIAGEIVGLGEAAKVADRLGLLGKERREFFEKAAVNDAAMNFVRSGSTRAYNGAGGLIR